MSSRLGKLFSILTFGESHGPGIGVVIEGCPAGLFFDADFVQHELNRRRPGQSKLTTQRKEPDTFQVLSGLVGNYTNGAPLTLFIPNQDAKSKDYEHLAQVYRPSHADFTYHKKYGLRDIAGGGRSSARETAARVAAGAVAKLWLKQVSQIEILAWVESIEDIRMPQDFINFDAEKVEAQACRCPHPETATAMEERIIAVRKAGDSVGGIIAANVKNVPIGLGEPVFDKLHALLGKAMLSIHAVKGFEYGSGFAGTRMRGSTHNDLWTTTPEGAPVTQTNYSGGIQGGISNGMPINFRVAFKPVATILRTQPTIDVHGKPATVAGKGRHDPCVLPRAVPIVEAMTALILADCLLRYKVYR